MFGPPARLTGASMLPLQVRARIWMRWGEGAGDSPQEGDPTVAVGPPFSLEPGVGGGQGLQSVDPGAKCLDLNPGTISSCLCNLGLVTFLCLGLPISKVGIIIMHPSQVCEVIK